MKRYSFSSRSLRQWQSLRLETAAEDLCFRKPFSGSSSRATLGLILPEKTHHINGVQRRIGLAVAAAIHSVAVAHAGTGRQGADFAKGSEGSLGANPLRVDAYCLQQDGCSINSHAIALP